MSTQPQVSTGKASLSKSAGAPTASAGASIVEVGKYASIPQILIKQSRQRQTWNDYLRKAFRDEGIFQRYLRAERYNTAKRIRAVGKDMAGWKQNNKSEWRMISAMPARDFMRLHKVDPHFIADKQNRRRLKADNPDMIIGS